MLKKCSSIAIVIIAIGMLYGCVNKNLSDDVTTDVYEELEDASYRALDSMFFFCVGDELYYYGEDIYDIKESDLENYKYITSITEFVSNAEELKDNQMNFDAVGCSVYEYSDTEVLVCWPKIQGGYQDAYKEDGELNVWSGRKCIFVRVKQME